MPEVRRLVIEPASGSRAVLAARILTVDAELPVDLEDVSEEEAFLRAGVSPTSSQAPWSRTSLRSAAALALLLTLGAIAGAHLLARGRTRYARSRVGATIEERDGQWPSYDEKGSCSKYGCIGFSNTNDCQCNSECIYYRSCCSDYEEKCMFNNISGHGKSGAAHRTRTRGHKRTNGHNRTKGHNQTKDHHRTKGHEDVKTLKGSCAKYGCIGFQPKHACQCNPDCADFDSCCHDAYQQCNETGKWARFDSLMERAQAEQEKQEATWRREEEEIRHPRKRCAVLSLGEQVEVRDTAISKWLKGTVSSLNPVAVTPGGWAAGYAWSSFRQGERICRPRKEQMQRPQNPIHCHTSVEGETCYGLVMHAKREEHNASATFEDIQAMLYEQDVPSCPRPCVEAAEQLHEPRCLCLFDVDRTLTCKQGKVDKCPGTKEVSGAKDWAFEGGTLALSELAQNIPSTFCSSCLRGIVSAGAASGWHSEERDVLLEALGGPRWTLSDTWSGPAPHVSSLLVLGAHDRHKQDSVRGMIRWLRDQKGVVIEDQEVHFFDDNVQNPPPFAGTGFNAHQVSCGSRGTTDVERDVGYCGGRSSEVIKKLGVHACSGPIETPTTTADPDR
mmetsp:Transcript_943/g.2823  ORF Transcript_943/g.2823 Transcript_943/m.2823 type:complete len:615 (+) Transcript_943:48-1892(+)